MNKNILVLLLLMIGAPIVAGSYSSSGARDIGPAEGLKRSVIAHLKTEGLTELVDNKRNHYFYHNEILTKLVTDHGIFHVSLSKNFAIENTTNKKIKAVCKNIKHETKGIIERTDAKHNHYFYHNGKLVKLVSKKGVVFNVSLRELKVTDILPESKPLVVRVTMKDGQK